MIAALTVVTEPAVAKEKVSKVLLKTSAGDIIIQLYNETPIHRDNFLKLVNEGFYNGLLFHRVIKDFMIQGGDPDSKNAPTDKELGEGGAGYTLPAEIRTPEIFHKRGVIAMAREGDDVNPERRSSGCQFYIVWGKTFSIRQLGQISAAIREATDGETEITPDQRMIYETQGGTPHLDGQYTVFGEVIKGLNIVKKIQQSPTNAHDRPLENIIILETKIL